MGLINVIHTVINTRHWLLLRLDGTPFSARSSFKKLKFFTFFTLIVGDTFFNYFLIIAKLYESCREKLAQISPNIP